MEKDSKEIVWDASEFEYHEKGPTWFWLTIIFTALVAIFSIGRGNFLFAIFVIVAELLILHWGRKKPREIRFRLEEKGIHAGRSFYPFSELEAFTFHGNEIVFKKKSRLSDYFKIYAHEEHLDHVKEFLSRHLPEFEYEESLMEHIAKLIGF